VLDETIDSLDALLRAHTEGATDVINLKISKVGGFTRARQIRDLCVSLGIARGAALLGHRRPGAQRDAPERVLGRPLVDVAAPRGRRRS
jgi:hypothetical protein